MKEKQEKKKKKKDRAQSEIAFTNDQLGENKTGYFEERLSTKKQRAKH